MSESEESYNCGNDRTPNLEFTPKVNCRQNNLAFSGFYIRPYMRSVNLVKTNLEDNLNIRINIVAPPQSIQVPMKSTIDIYSPAKVKQANTNPDSEV